MNLTEEKNKLSESSRIKSMMESTLLKSQMEPIVAILGETNF